MSVVDITREDWVQETERLCPSSLAFNAYVELEEMIVADTDLAVTYKRVPRGKSSYCTCLLYTSPSPRDRTRSRMPSSA